MRVWLDCTPPIETSVSALEAIASGLATTPAKLAEVAACAFAASQCEWTPLAMAKAKRAAAQEAAAAAAAAAAAKEEAAAAVAGGESAETPPAPEGAESAAAPAESAAAPAARAASDTRVVETAQQQRALEAGIDAAVRWLKAPSIESTSVANRRRQRGAPLIQLIGTADGPRFVPTRAGTATHLSGLKPTEGVVLLDSLREVALRFYTGSTLQLTILLTPFREHALKTSSDRWGLVLRRLGGLVADERRLLELQGIDFEWLRTKASGVTTHADLSAAYQEHLALRHLRAYDAIVLRELHRGMALEDTARRFGYAGGEGSAAFGTLGELQTLQTAAQTYMAQVKAF